MFKALAPFVAIIALQSTAFADNLPGCDPVRGESLALKKIQQARKPMLNTKIYAQDIGSERVVRSGKTYTSVIYTYTYSRDRRPWERTRGCNDPRVSGRVMGYLVLDEKCKVVAESEVAPSISEESSN